MAETSAIEWTDATWNPWMGCTKVSPACDHCYAAVSRAVTAIGVVWGAGQPRHRTSATNWKLPRRWNARPFVECMSCEWRGEAAECSTAQNPTGFHPPAAEMKLCPRCMEPTLKEARRRVFCASLADWLDNQVPAEWLAELLNQIRLTPDLDWLLLTKRIGNWESRLTVAHQHVVKTMGGGTAEQAEHPLWSLGMWIQDWIAGKAPANVWIGATICNQAEADRDVLKLLRVQAAVRFLSIEPMLERIDLTTVKVTQSPGYFGDCLDWYHQPHCSRKEKWNGIDWVIVGGESGPRARPMHPDWARSLRDQCAAAGVPFLFKQWGEHLPADADECDAGVSEKRLVWSDGQTWNRDDGQRGGVALMARVGKKAAGRLLDGKIHTEFPEVKCG